MRLDEVRVLDLTRLLPGPYATQLLADLGADVIKVEDPDDGDYARDLPPVTDRGTGAVFEAVNRGKRSVAIDLKRDAGLAAFHDLAADADVVVEGFRPGVAERLGVGPDALRERNPDLVYCSLSGYGATGPYRDRPGHDINYVGLAGLLDMTRANAAERPRIPGVPISDMAGGLFGAFAIVAALLDRELGSDAVDGDGTDADPSGESNRSSDNPPRATPSRGATVDASLTEAVLSFTAALAPTALDGDEPRPGETPLTGELPWYDVYEAADGRYVTVGILEVQFWERFCEGIGREGLIDAFGTDDPAEREAVREVLRSTIGDRTHAEWAATFAELDVPADVVSTMTEALNHPQTRARGLVTDDGGVPRLALPFRVDDERYAATGPLPDHGADTAGVLRAAGYDDGRIDDLLDSGAVGPRR